MKTIIGCITALLLLLSITAHAQGNKIEKYVLELLPEEIAKSSYDDLFWSKCLGEEEKLSNKQIGARIKALINDEPNRIAFYKRVNYYLSGYERAYNYFNIYKDVAVSAELKKELKVKSLLNNEKKENSLFFKEDMNGFIKYMIAFGSDDSRKCSSDGIVYETTEQAPEFDGGDLGLLKFLQYNVTYPNMERDNDIQGKVIIEFVVCEDGSVANARIKQKISQGLDAEALKVVRMLPKFKPAKQNGVAVKCKYTLPVVFKLQ